MSSKRLAVIPARGGSKRIPNKNIRDFCGMPMLAYILRSAQESGLFDTIHVSTDDEKISAIAREYGFHPQFSRSPSLAGDTTPIMAVLKDVYQKYAEMGVYFDEIWLLMACSPLIEANHLNDASRVFQEHKSQRPLLAVSEYAAPIEWAFELNTASELTPVSPGMFARPSSELESRYYDAGAFAIFPTEVVSTSEGAGSDRGFLGFKLPKWSSVDIDEEEDWELAERLFLGKVVKVGRNN